MSALLCLVEFKLSHQVQDFSLQAMFDCRRTLLFCTCRHRTSQILLFCRLSVCDRPALSTFIGTNFPTVFAYFVSLCHILITLAMFQTFPFLLYFLWWSVICHLWCYYWCRECSGNSQRTSIISRAWNVTELLQSHDDNLNKWGVASYRWAKEMISWNAVYSWWRCCEYCLNDSKGLKIIS